MCMCVCVSAHTFESTTYRLWLHAFHLFFLLPTCGEGFVLFLQPHQRLWVLLKDLVYIYISILLSNEEARIAQIQEFKGFVDLALSLLPSLLGGAEKMKKVIKVFQMVKKSSRRRRRWKEDFRVEEEMESQGSCDHHIGLCNLHLCVRGKETV